MTDALHDLRRLLPAGEPAVVAGILPPGRPVKPDGHDEDAAPVLWLSDGPAPRGLWEQLHRLHPQTGLWPLLLAPLSRTDREFRPWETGEFDRRSAGEPDWYDPASVLRRGWEQATGTDAEGDPYDAEDLAEIAEVVAPFAGGWPGPAPAPDRRTDPDAAARALATELLATHPDLRIGLVAAATGAEALTACGWTGPENHEDDIARVSAVLLDWERRFGTRLVQVGFADLVLSVAAPPADTAAALRTAAEHLAICPDNILQGPGSLAKYAGGLVGADQWSFWWD
ncbi:DUF4253 domain-containing protein [Kitasatospora sp. NPDC048365]|uniref:DUF4253 domain-containing protein n=1 Tax=Kitasatospora sp. NPDC048365 TaxID=3364050 RepID=UPI00371DF052